MGELVGFFTDPKNWSGTLGIPNRLFEHLQISVLAVIFAAAIAVPVGLYIGHTNRGSNLAINVANIGRAIPSYALMAILLILTLELSTTGLYSAQFGLTFLPAFLAMMFLAIPPLLVATYAGLRSVDRELIEAARGMGLREVQILRQIEMPLASSIIIGGLRTATLQVIATATIAAILGGGGLGRFIFDGIAQGEIGKTSIFAGAILVTALAIGVDLLLAWAQNRLTPRSLRKPRRAPRRPFTGFDKAVRPAGQPQT